MVEQGLFRRFSGIARTAARRVVRAPNPVHSVLNLVLAFVNVCALMLRLQVEFMALIFMVVYVGAIAVLFLFVVMMLNLTPQKERTYGESVRRAMRSGVRALERWRMGARQDRLKVEGTEVMNSEQRQHVIWVNRMDPRTNLEVLGQVLYTHYFIYVLAAGFVLLVAMIGAIVLTLKVRGFAMAKRQQIHQQRSRDADRAVLIARIK